MAVVIINSTGFSIADLTDCTEIPCMEMLYAGEVGRLEGIRIIESPSVQQVSLDLHRDRQIKRLERSRNPRDQLLARTLKQRRAKGG